nr:immunoglobulin heavy chain junction region [Mus musculus]
CARLGSRYFDYW